MAERRRTIRSLARGHAAELRERGVRIDRRGRARDEHGHFISRDSLARRVARIEAAERRERQERAEKAQLTRTRLDKQLAKQPIIAPDGQTNITADVLAQLRADKGKRTEVAQRIGVTEKTIRTWLAKGGVSPERADQIRAFFTVDTAGRQQRIYGATWESGRREHATREQLREVREAMRAFIRARDVSDPRVHQFYLAWRAAKDRVRAQLTKDAWRTLVARIGKQEGLDTFGAFSVLRFTTS